MQTVKVWTSVERSKALAADPAGYMAMVRAEAHEEANRPSAGRRRRRRPAE